MEHDVVPIDQADRILLPKQFLRKGKVLVFSTPGNVTLSEETAREILESVRAERDCNEPIQ